jgi:hypothetical protein
MHGHNNGNSDRPDHDHDHEEVDEGYMFMAEDIQWYTFRDSSNLQWHLHLHCAWLPLLLPALLEHPAAGFRTSSVCKHEMEQHDIRHWSR